MPSPILVTGSLTLSFELASTFNFVPVSWMAHKDEVLHARGEDEHTGTGGKSVN